MKKLLVLMIMFGSYFSAYSMNIEPIDKAEQEIAQKAQESFLSQGYVSLRAHEKLVKLLNFFMDAHQIVWEQTQLFEMFPEFRKMIVQFNVYTHENFEDIKQLKKDVIKNHCLFFLQFVNDVSAFLQKEVSFIEHWRSRHYEKALSNLIGVSLAVLLVEFKKELKQIALVSDEQIIQNFDVFAKIFEFGTYFSLSFPGIYRVYLKDAMEGIKKLAKEKKLTEQEVKRLEQTIKETIRSAAVSIDFKQKLFQFFNDNYLGFVRELSARQARVSLQASTSGPSDSQNRKRNWGQSRRKQTSISRQKTQRKAPQKAIGRSPKKPQSEGFWGWWAGAGVAAAVAATYGYYKWWPKSKTN